MAAVLAFMQRSSQPRLPIGEIAFAMWVSFQLSFHRPALAIISPLPAVKTPCRRGRGNVKVRTIGPGSRR